MRIQVLELPLKTAGEFAEAPFALVFDQASSASAGPFRSEMIHKEAEAFAKAIGAVGALVTAETVEVVR